MRVHYLNVCAVLAEPSRWTQGAEARDAAGAEVDVYGDTTVCWCLLGAITRIYGRIESPQYFQAIGVVKRALHDLFGWTGPVDEWNDARDRTHTEVLSVVLHAGV